MPSSRDGLMIEPLVSVPMPSAESDDWTAAPVPEDEPLGVSSASLALRTWPVRLLKPEAWPPK